MYNNKSSNTTPSRSNISSALKKKKGSSILVRIGWILGVIIVALFIYLLASGNLTTVVNNILHKNQTTDNPSSSQNQPVQSRTDKGCCSISTPSTFTSFPDDTNRPASDDPTVDAFLYKLGDPSKGEYITVIKQAKSSGDNTSLDKYANAIIDKEYGSQIKTSRATMKKLDGIENPHKYTVFDALINFRNSNDKAKNTYLRVIQNDGYFYRIYGDDYGAIDAETAKADLAEYIASFDAS